MYLQSYEQRWKKNQPDLWSEYKGKIVALDLLLYCTTKFAKLKLNFQCLIGIRAVLISQLLVTTGSNHTEWLVCFNTAMPSPAMKLLLASQISYSMYWPKFKPTFWQSSTLSLHGFPEKDSLEADQAAVSPAVQQSPWSPQKARRRLQHPLRFLQLPQAPQLRSTAHGDALSHSSQRKSSICKRVPSLQAMGVDTLTRGKKRQNVAFIWRMMLYQCPTSSVNSMVDLNLSK